MYQRMLERPIRDALGDTPVVLIHGPRQSGKTTLAEVVAGERGRQRLSLDRTAVLAAARSDPDGFVDGLEGPVLLDEVQRAPELFAAIKHAVDRDRTPGRFLLTGSANALVLPRLSESLAGRMEVLTLWPLAQAEIQGSTTNFVDRLFGGGPLGPAADGETDVWERVLRGGYPEAVARRSHDRRAAWFGAYIDTLLQRDIRDLANIEGVPELHSLLRLLAARSANLLNYADVTRGLSLSQSTVKRYFALLEAMFLIVRVPAWSTNQSSRVVKSAKVFVCDSGLGAAVLGADRDRLAEDGSLRGSLLETFVAGELVRLLGGARVRARVHHFRTASGAEVDLVLEGADGRVVGVEVKSGASIDRGAFRGLDALRAAARDRFHRGVVLYCGGETVPFGEGLWAVPIGALWSE
ncbi:MAG: ATP-binding protein [Phycisphaerales bacterium]|nr:ATP-binding protein [Phycisphaerales bacterium]